MICKHLHANIIMEICISDLNMGNDVSGNRYSLYEKVIEKFVKANAWNLDVAVKALCGCIAP